MLYAPYALAEGLCEAQNSNKRPVITTGERSLLHDRAGMSLMETVFALGILIFGLGAAVTLVGSAIGSSQQNKDMIVVTNLAREAIEIVRTVRDGSQAGQGFASLTQGVWLVDADTTTFDTASETLVPALVAQGVGSPAVIQDCSNCELVMVDGRYVTSDNTGGTPTPYARMVEIIDTPVVPPETVYQKRVIASVMWTVKGRSHVYTLETELWDWK